MESTTTEEASSRITSEGQSWCQTLAAPALASTTLILSLTLEQSPFVVVQLWVLSQQVGTPSLHATLPLLAISSMTLRGKLLPELSLLAHHFMTLRWSQLQFLSPGPFLQEPSTTTSSIQEIVVVRLQTSKLL